MEQDNLGQEKLSRTMVKLIHADNFFPGDDAEKLFWLAKSLQFVNKDYGQEIDQFNLVQPGIDKVLSKVIGEEIIVDEERSGVFRQSMVGIHFEGFDNPNEWCFIVALEDNVPFNIYKHKSGAESALQGYKFNYRNFFEWDYYCNFQLMRNQGVIFRPWLFHSINNGMVQYYRLLPKND